VSLQTQIALLEAIYQRIGSDPDIVQLVGNRISNVPLYRQAEQNFPQITFNITGTTDASTFDQYGNSHTIQIDVWSRQQSTLEARQLHDLIFRSMVGDHPGFIGLPALTHGRLYLLRFIDSSVYPDPDGVTTHGVLLFRAFTEEI